MCEFTCYRIRIHSTDTVTIFSTSESGAVRTWVWFEAVKPFAQAHDGRLPFELPVEPTSWLVFAMPMRQIAKLEED